MHVHEGRVVPARHVDHFAAGCLLGRVDSRLGQRGLILVGNHNEKRALHLGGVPARTVEATGQNRASRNGLLPVGVPMAGIEDARARTRYCIRRREQRDGPGLAGQRHQQWCSADQTAEPVHDAPAGEPQHCALSREAHRVTHRGRTIGRGRLRDRGRELGIAGRHAEDVPARQGEAPDRDPARIDGG